MAGHQLHPLLDVYDMPSKNSIEDQNIENVKQNDHTQLLETRERHNELHIFNP